MILAAAVIAAVAQAVPPAKLCVAGVCHAATKTFAAAEVPRAFVWIAGDASRIITGTIPVGATHAPLSDEGRVAHSFTLAPSDGNRKLAVSFQLRCGERTWEWPLPRISQRAIELVRAPADCTLRVHADGYKPAETPLATAKLDTLYLHRLPVLSGRIIDASTRVPIAGADILRPEGERLASSDGEGRFRAAIDSAWPGFLRVEAPGRATKIVTVPKAVADADLAIALSTGGAIVLELPPSLDQEPEEIRWEVRRMTEKHASETVRGGTIERGRRFHEIEALDAGLYSVLLSGQDPLQRVAVDVLVRDGATTEKTVEIDPARLEIEALLGAEPFADAKVELLHGDGGWRANLTTDSEGRIVEEIWQRGRYAAHVGMWSDKTVIDEDDDAIEWKLSVPDRIVRGRVIDAVDGRPLPGAGVMLQVRRDGEGSTTRFVAMTGPDGSFEYKLVPAGTYTVEARTRGYQPLVTPPAILAEETHLETRDLKLRAVTGHVVRVSNAYGVPVAGAAIAVVSNRRAKAVGGTGEDGRFTLPLEEDEHGAVYVLPRSGSFASVRFASMAEAGAQEIPVTIPEGTVTLDLRARSKAGDPLGGITFAMRINGAFIPPPVLEAMSRHQGLPMYSDAAGTLTLARLPAGRYEIWPIASRDDSRAVWSPFPPPAPVNVVLTAGHHAADMTFQTKE